ncbi:MAG: hypothetical protein IIZ93_00640 [Acidaminococcaceae bacterium]|nr:hypothetical protein [Acidaminococcaceae bacterium]
MSEYRGGPLDELADLFMKALKADDPHEKNRLIDEWNEKIKFINSVLKGR